MANPTNESRQSNEPDTARTYERAKPEKEGGMGSLDNDGVNRPIDKGDHSIAAVPNAHEPFDAGDHVAHQQRRAAQKPQVAGSADKGTVNAIRPGSHTPLPDDAGRSTASTAGGQQTPAASGAPSTSRGPVSQQPDHSMKDEEPLGWDQAPKEPAQREQKRHSRLGGKGGTPDEGEARVGG